MCFLVTMYRNEVFVSQAQIMYLIEEVEFNMTKYVTIYLMFAAGLNDIVHCSINKDVASPDLLEVKFDASYPEVSPKYSLPFLPLQAPSPLLPFTNYSSLPELSGN